MTSLLAVEHGRLHHDGQAQLALVDLLLALLAAGAVGLGVLRPERQVVGGHGVGVRSLKSLIREFPLRHDETSRNCMT